MKRLMTMAAVVLLAAGAAVAGEYTETFDRTYAMDHGGRVALENINGDVTIEVWDEAEVRVYAVKRASSTERLDALRSMSMLRSAVSSSTPTTPTPATSAMAIATAGGSRVHPDGSEIRDHRRGRAGQRGSHHRWCRG